jgi:hypothetical protein
MDAAKKARVLDRNRRVDASQSQRGDRQIVLPMSREQFDDCWSDAVKMRKLVDRLQAENPELFPASLSCAVGRVNDAFPSGKRHLDPQSLHYKTRSGLKRSGISIPSA